MNHLNHYFNPIKLGLTLLLFSINVYGQKDGNTWYFGSLAGISFNGVAAVPLLNGAMYSIEGCSVVSDTSGNILMYTNGENIWDRNHNLMNNGTGLVGHNSSSQSSVIVKKPGQNTIYYIFTTDYFAGSEGLCYSEVDLSMNNGLGAVTTSKNILLNTPVCEKLTTARHYNGQDIWVIVHKYNSDEIYSYLVTNSGVGLIPVISNTGVTVSGGTQNFAGQIKVSPDKSKVALAHLGEYWHNVMLFDFDSNTGALSYFTSLKGFNNEKAYAVEFSPNSSLLYVAEGSPGGSNIYQYNLYAGSIADIKNSKLMIGTYLGMGGALQLAPDGKIYHAQNQSDYLGVIHSPNTLGFLCNYSSNDFYLNGRESTLGLPQYVLDVPTHRVNVSQTCFTDTTLFYFNPASNIDSITWNFDDPITGVSNFSSGVFAQHVFSTADTFNVIATVFEDGSIDSIIKQIIINPVPVVHLGNDTVLCENEILQLKPVNIYPNHTYLWSTGSTDSLIIATQSGVYTVVASEGDCFNSDTISVTHVDLPLINLGEDTIICSGDTLKLEPAFQDSLTYFWYDNSTDTSKLIAETGTYWVEASNGFCSSADSILITVYDSIRGSIDIDSSYCQYTSFSVGFNADSVDFVWSNGFTDSLIYVYSTGTYWVNLFSYPCWSSDTMYVTVKDCPDETFQIVSIPNIFTPNDDLVNDHFSLDYVGFPKEFNVSIYNRWGNVVFTSDSIDFSWNGSLGNKICPESTYYFVINYTASNNHKIVNTGHLFLVR